MDKLSELEADPVQQIHKVMLAITGGSIDPEAIMSNSVYLKNFGNTVIRNASNSCKGPNVEQSVVAKTLTELLAIIKIFVQGMLAPNLEMKYKHNFTVILSRLFI